VEFQNLLRRFSVISQSLAVKSNCSSCLSFRSRYSSELSSLTSGGSLVSVEKKSGENSDREEEVHLV